MTLHVGGLELDLVRRSAFRDGQQYEFRGHTYPLRFKVDDPFPTKLIHTVRGMGDTLEER